jgi:hypothetical protein
MVSPLVYPTCLRLKDFVVVIIVVLVVDKINTFFCLFRPGMLVLLNVISVVVKVQNKLLRQ